MVGISGKGWTVRPAMVTCSVEKLAAKSFKKLAARSSKNMAGRSSQEMQRSDALLLPFAAPPSDATLLLLLIV